MKSKKYLLDLVTLLPQEELLQFHNRDRSLVCQKIP